MSEALRLSSVALFVVGPTVAVLALLRRAFKPSPTLSRIRGWRWYVPVVLLPVEWLLPPALIALRVGEIEAGWLPVRAVGLAVGLAGAVLLVWAAVRLGRLLIHEAGVRKDHTLIESGPYRFVRHPVYTGYLALLLGSGVASFNGCILLLWPVSLLGILIQAASEEQLLAARFGRDYERYVGRIGRLVPRCWSRTAESDVRRRRRDMPSPTPPGPEKAPELEGMPASVRQALEEVATAVEALHRDQAATIAEQAFERAADLRARAEALRERKAAILREWQQAQ
jgi:protein-S-isoprenylcysteine O-methyltransferase Ste14